MPKNGPLKSAYEIAMERLREQDRKRGVKQSKPLTEARKREIARLRAEARSKLAELEILHRKDLTEHQGDREKIQELEEKHRIDLDRVRSRLESAVARIRASRGPQQKKAAKKKRS